MILIQNAHIKPIVGPELPNGCLLAEDGRITAVAPHIDAPEGCTVIDAGGRLLTPGCVEAHCHIGLDNQCMRWEGMDYNEIVDPLTPQLRAIDSINPQDGAFPNALRGGVTTACTGPGSANVVGGTFTVLKLAGKRYLTGPVIFYRTDGHSTIVSLTVEDIYRFQTYLESHSTTLMADGQKLTCICID